MRLRSLWGAGGLAGVLLLAACGRNSGVPTFKVTPTTVTRRITAEGNLKAVKATPITAPHDAPN